MFAYYSYSWPYCLLVHYYSVNHKTGTNLIFKDCFIVQLEKSLSKIFLRPLKICDKPTSTRNQIII